MVKKLLVLLVTLALMHCGSAFGLAATPKSGTLCSPRGKILVVGAKKYTCVKSGSKLVWSPPVGLTASKPSQIPSPTPSIVPSPTPSIVPSPIPTPVICTGSGESNVDGYFRVKLRLVSALDATKPLRSASVFLRQAGGNWELVRGIFNGEVTLHVKTGLSEIDTLPAIRTDYLSLRKRYLLDIANDGTYKIPDSHSNQGLCNLDVPLSDQGQARHELISSETYKSSFNVLPVNTPTETVRYKLPISNTLGKILEVDLYPWEGEHVVLLTPTNDLNRMAVARYLASLDRAWELYDAITGNFSKLDESKSVWARTFHGKAVIASIPDLLDKNSAEMTSCGGNACTAYSTLGVEMRWEVLETSIWEIQYFDLYDFTGIYELGRTFWDYKKCGPVLSFPVGEDVAPTGFAVLMMHFLSDEMKIINGPEDSISGLAFETKIRKIESTLTSTPSLTLNQMTQPMTIDGFNRNSIWASLMYKLGSENGGLDFFAKFFQNCDRLPAARSNLESLMNLKVLAELAAGKTLDSYFVSQWKFSSNG